MNFLLNEDFSIYIHSMVFDRNLETRLILFKCILHLILNHMKNTVRICKFQNLTSTYFKPMCEVISCGKITNFSFIAGMYTHDNLLMSVFYALLVLIPCHINSLKILIDTEIIRLDLLEAVDLRSSAKYAGGSGKRGG